MDSAPIMAPMHSVAPSLVDSKLFLALVAATLGFLVGSLQAGLSAWLSERSTHRRQLRLLRAELRRLSGFIGKYNWKVNEAPATDEIPFPVRITDSYERLIQDTDFWLTDEHDDDNTQEALLNIVDGARLLGKYDSAVHELMDASRAHPPHEKQPYVARAIGTAQVYDRELDRWQVMVKSALADVERRIKQIRFLKQIWRTIVPMPKGANPPLLPPLDHSDIDIG